MKDPKETLHGVQMNTGDAKPLQGSGHIKKQRVAKHHSMRHMHGKHGKDGVAHATHHANNQKHGTEHGFQAGECYEEGSCENSHLGCNEEHHE